MQALLADYPTTLTEHRQLAAWVDSDKAVLNHPEIGARLHRNTDTVPGHRRLQHRRHGSHRSRDGSTRFAVAPGPHPELGTTRHPPRRPHPRSDGWLRADQQPVRPTGHVDLTSTPVHHDPWRRHTAYECPRRIGQIYTNGVSGTDLDQPKSDIIAARQRRCSQPGPCRGHTVPLWTVLLIRARLLEAAPSAKQTYAHIGTTMDVLATRGGEHVSRRRGRA